MDTTTDNLDPSEIAQQPSKKLTMAERARLARRAQYDAAKERKKKYLSSPEIQAKLIERKEQQKAYRKEKSTQLKTKSKADHKLAKQELAKAIKDSKQQKQELRDQELKTMLKPALTLLKGGASE